MIKRSRFWLFSLAMLAAVSFLMFGLGSQAYASNPQTINFQGKVVNSDGTNVANGSYTFIFRLYNNVNPATYNPNSLSCSSDTNCYWQETDNLTVKNGTFQVNLGGNCSFSSACSSSHSGINFNTDNNLSLTMQFAGDSGGFMTPLVQFSSVPYAFNSDELGGISSSGFIQNTTSTQANTNFNISGTGVASIFQAANFDTTTSGGAIGLGTTNASSITQGNVNATFNFEAQSASSAYKFQNATSQNSLSINTSNGVTTLGQAGVGGLSGGLLLDYAGQTGGIALSPSNPGSNVYTLTLPAETGTICTTAATGTCNTAGGLSNVAYLNQSQTFSGANTFEPTSSSSKAIQAIAQSNPSSDTVTISTQSVDSNSVNALNINYSGGSAGVQASAFRIDYTPGSGSGGAWNGMRIVDDSGANSGVSENGLLLDGPAANNGGTDEAINIGSGWGIGVDINSGGMELADMTSDPSVPASGELKVYAEDVDGRSMLKEEGPSGVAYVAQPSLFQQNVVLVTGGNGTSTSTYTTVGSNVTAAGTLASTSGSVSEALGNTSRIATGTTSGTAAGFYTKNVYYLGSIANGASGFFYFARMNLDGQALSNYENSSGSRIFMGMCSATFTACAGSDSPTSSAAGFQQSGTRGDTDFQFLTCNRTNCNTIDTGVAITNTDTYDFYVYAAPQGSTVYWRIDDLTTGASPVTGSTTADIPLGNLGMNAGMTIENLSAANRYLYFQRMYFETDR